MLINYAEHDRYHHQIGKTVQEYQNMQYEVILVYQTQENGQQLYLDRMV